MFLILCNSLKLIKFIKTVTISRQDTLPEDFYYNIEVCCWLLLIAIFIYLSVMHFLILFYVNLAVNSLSKVTKCCYQKFSLIIIHILISSFNTF